MKLSFANNLDNKLGSNILDLSVSVLTNAAANPTGGEMLEPNFLFSNIFANLMFTNPLLLNPLLEFPDIYIYK